MLSKTLWMSWKTCTLKSLSGSSHSGMHDSSPLFSTSAISITAVCLQIPNFLNKHAVQSKNPKIARAIKSISILVFLLWCTLKLHKFLELQQDNLWYHRKQLTNVSPPLSELLPGSEISWFIFFPVGSTSLVTVRNGYDWDHYHIFVLRLFDSCVW